QGPFAVWQTREPLRFAAAEEGVFMDGTVTGKAAYSRWVGPPGMLSVRLEGTGRATLLAGDPVSAGSNAAQIGRAVASRTVALAPLGALVAFVAWQGVSIGWSVLPDRSWDYLNLGLVYLAFAACGVAVGGLVPLRSVAGVLAVVLGATVVWALLGKVFPGLY